MRGSEKGKVKSEKGRRIVTAVDLFCGAGGTSTGMIQALSAKGYGVRVIGVNHWPKACDTHHLNHPDQPKPLCTSIDAINPRELGIKEGSLDWLVASPECTFHSNALGGKPVNDQSRATAFCVPRWIEALRPRHVMVENVPEFLNWGPLGHNGRPLKSKKGEVFLAWAEMCRAFNYRVDWRIECAADYGDPTTRRRLIVRMERSRGRIYWPVATHAALGSEKLKVKSGKGGRVKPHKSAREHVIDWKRKGRWLHEMPPQARYDGLPLSPNTIRRIHEGFLKQGLKNFVLNRNRDENGVSPRSHDLDEPLPTMTGALVEPFLISLRGTEGRQLSGCSFSIDGPVPAVTAGGGHLAVAEPFVFQMNHAGPARSFSVEECLPTICGNRGELGLIEASLLPQQSAGRLRPVSEPVPTITTDGGIAIVEPYLVEYYGTGGAQGIDEPLNTVTCKDRHALVQPRVVINGREGEVWFRYRMLQPHELSLAQGFPRDYQFTGNKTEQVKQIGNAVPCGLARAVILAAYEGDKGNVRKVVRRG